MNHFIDNSAQIGEDVKIGNYTSVMKNVKIGKASVIGNNVTVYEGTVIGENVRIDDNSIIGKQRLRAKWSVVQDSIKKSALVIGNECVIGANVVLYSGSSIGDRVLVADSPQEVVDALGIKGVRLG